MTGIYLHIPFCKQACSYCDFYFVTRQEYREAFVDKLVKEIRSYNGSKFVREPVDTVYFGGGTPSLLEPGEIRRIMETLRATFSLEPVEVTLEMNPDDVTEQYLAALRDLGVNRASMGVQSFRPELLDFMHRAHDREDALRCMKLLKAAGFETFTVDLIYGNPNQSPEDLQQDLDELLEFDPPHVSAYSLTIEPRTRLGKQVELGRILPPDDEMVADHFDRVVATLKEAGIDQYEVSNYSKPGQEAIHNSNYWRHENYLGVGPAAHSFWWDDERAVRWQNRSDLMDYLEETPEAVKEETEILGLPELAEERLMMGLRTREGISHDELKRRYHYELNERQRSYLEKMKEERKAELSDTSFRFTYEGLKIADTLILDLVTMN